MLAKRLYMLCTSKSSLVFKRHRVANDMMSMNGLKVLGPHRFLQDNGSRIPRDGSYMHTVIDLEILFPWCGGIDLP